jgi:DNA replicative helicase MCM subunit Mcm2 (Cdc46/Mcm family)
MSAQYKTGVKKMLDAEERRLIVNLDDLRDFDREFCDGFVPFPPSLFPLLTHSSYRLLKEPAGWLPAADAALKDMAINSSNAGLGEALKQETFYVGFKGSFGENHTTPRTLKSDKLGKMICMEGIVTRCSFFFSSSLLHGRLTKRDTQATSSVPRCNNPSTTVTQLKTSIPESTPTASPPPPPPAPPFPPPPTPKPTPTETLLRSSMGCRRSWTTR